MRKSLILISILFVIPLSSGIPLTGVFEGDGYVTNEITFENDSTFITDRFNYSGENGLIIKGDYEDLDVSLETFESENSVVIQDREKMTYTNNSRIRFEPLSGNRGRLVISGRQGATVESLELEKNRNKEMPLIFYVIAGIFGAGLLIYMSGRYI
jgi:hypothetical protein